MSYREEYAAHHSVFSRIKCQMLRCDPKAFPQNAGDCRSRRLNRRMGFSEIEGKAARVAAGSEGNARVSTRRVTEAKLKVHQSIGAACTVKRCLRLLAQQPLKAERSQNPVQRMNITALRDDPTGDPLIFGNQSSSARGLFAAFKQPRRLHSCLPAVSLNLLSLAGVFR